MSVETNPLLNLPLSSGSSSQAVTLPFSKLKSEHVVPAVEALIEKSKRALEAIYNAPRTYDGTLGALEEATAELDLAMVMVGHLESVVTDHALRAAYEKAQLLASAFYSTIALDVQLYRALQEFSETKEVTSLSTVKKRLLKKTLEDFEKHGAKLNDAGKARLREIATELAQLTTKFSQNVLDDTREFELLVTDEAKLQGLPESAKLAAQESAKAKALEGYRFTLQAPSYIAVMTHLDDAAIREQVWRAYNTRASAFIKREIDRNNAPNILNILKLRKEKAQLLGFPDFADFVLSDRMAKNGKSAADFVARLRTKTQAAFDKEKKALADFAREVTGNAGYEIKPWDVGYFAEKLRKARYDFDEEALRPYFSVPAVIAGLFEVASALYGVRVEPYETDSWHDDVTCYGIWEGDTLLCTFFVDLYPREEKRGGAWMNAFVYSPNDEPHVGLFCANVSPPIGGKPALLKHREVETLFHEFGHLLHHALSDVPVKSLGGTNVAWDFVELPSQIMENFCWERESLDRFAKHVETGEPLPDALFEKLLRTRTFRAASAQMRQLGFADMDLMLHREFDLSQGDDALLGACRDRLADYSTTPLPNEYAMVCGFSHLFSSPTGYAAGYYSYKWAEVLDADTFSRFLSAEDGVLSRAVGSEFRQQLLSKGNSAEPAELFLAFMGREPSEEALLSRQGLS